MHTRSEAILRAIVQTAVDGIITIDAQGIVQEFNPAAETIFGYTAREIIGQNVSLLMPSPYREQHDKYIAAYLTSGQSKIIGIGREVVGVHKNGNRIPLELALSEVQDGSQRYFTAILRNISQRKSAEAERETMLTQITRSHEHLVSIFNMLRLGVITLDAKGTVISLNSMVEGIIGKGFRQVRGTPLLELLPLKSTDAQQLLEQLQRGTADAKRHLLRVSFPDGRRYWLESEVNDDPRNSTRKILLLYDVSEVYDLRQMLHQQSQYGDLVGKSDVMQDVYRRIQDVAKVDWTVLIDGETGTGKELVARAIHKASHRQTGPFVAFNCAGLTDSLLTSQLFGHKRGAFTGAVDDHKGLFEVARGGTIFLDEIGDISASMQSNLLRVLEEKEIIRLGESKPHKIDVRILAATHRDLAAEVKQGRFRSDLLYRIRVVRIVLPPLQKRREDIPLLISAFMAQSRAATGKSVEHISNDAMRVMMAYSWPGNVRELKSAIEFAVLHSRGVVIQPTDLPPEIEAARGENYGAEELVYNERDEILKALKHARGNRTEAARLMGMSRATFYRRLTRFDIR